MRYFIMGFIAIAILLVGYEALAYAEPTMDEWQSLTDNFKNSENLDLFGYAFLACQALFLFSRSLVGEHLGLRNLIFLALLSLVVTIGTKYLAGISILTALTDAPTLMAYQVLLHQIVKQWKKKELDHAKQTACVKPTCDGMPER